MFKCNYEQRQPIRHVVNEKSVTAFEEEELGGSKSMGETEATGFTTCPVILLTRPPPTPTKRTGNNSESTTGNQQLCKRHSFSASINQNQLLGKFPGGLEAPGSAWMVGTTSHQAWSPPGTKWRQHGGRPTSLNTTSSTMCQRIQNTKTDLTLCTQVYHSKHVSETTIMPEINDTPNQCTIDKIQIHKLFEAFLPQLDTLAKFVS